MGNSLLCHYIDNCFKKGIILWGQKHCDWGAKLRNGGHLPPSSNVKKGSDCYAYKQELLCKAKFRATIIAKSNRNAMNTSYDRSNSSFS